MKKDEILQKAQAHEGLDEMELQVIQRGCQIAMWIGLAACTVLMVCKGVAHQPWQDCYGLCCTMVASLHLYKWHKLRERHHLVWGILWAAMAVLLFSMYFVQLYR